MKFLQPLILALLITGTSYAQYETRSLHTDPHDHSDNVQGIDLKNMDLNIQPMTDFYGYVNGGWIKGNPIPAGYSRWSSFSEVEARNEIILKQILDEALISNAPQGSNMQKLGDLYYTAADYEGREKAGIEPITPYLQKIDAIQNSADMQLLLAEFLMNRIGSIFWISAGQDDKNSSIYVPQMYQSGLGLPDRDYYFEEGEKYKTLRDEYVKHITKMFELAGYLPVQAKQMADVVMKIETRLAGASMTRLERRDPEKTYNKMTLSELQSLMPDFDWPAFFTAAEFELNEDFNNGIIVGQPDFMKEVNKMMTDVAIDDWKIYLKHKLLGSTADLLSSNLENERFYFYNTILRGIDEKRPDWKIAVDRVEGSLGEVLGQMFVERAFSPQAKEKALIMVDNIKDAMRQRIMEIEWMEDVTKQEAIKKLNAFTPKIGYPDKWRDYSGLTIDRSSLLENVHRANRFYYKRNIERIGKPVEDEWFMNPQTVNAYYSASRNEIVFPAGILQPPFFSESFDDAINYGGIGGVIGHEITHGFDDQGRKYDANGNLRDWWTEADGKRYEELAGKLADQYSSYVAIDDVHLEGELTLGENIADLGGIKLAYIALMKSLEGKETPLIGGFTPEQRFFISWAQIWRNNITDEELRLRINTDSHSPGKYRAFVPPSNMTEFYEAFGGEPGDPMVRPEADRVVIW
jgi:putative endopeptidase